LEGSIADETLKALTKEPFRLTHMSPVQAEVLPLLPQIAEPFTSNDGPPRDILVRAKTGTGKTLAFLIPAVEARLKALQAYGEQVALDAGMKNDPSLISRARRAYASENVGTLIISPTRELASQIAEEAMRLTRHHPGFNVLMFTGGASRRDQMREWTRGRKDIVVGTPGRLRDVLDEPEVAKGFSKTQLVRPTYS
jgi:ATP-dependent RNA helicase MSS116